MDADSEERKQSSPTALLPLLALSHLSQTYAGIVKLKEAILSRGGLIVGLGGFFITLPFGFLDFDTHHDGIMLAPAVAVSEGIPLFSGAFSQYGPVTSWLHGGFLAVWPFGEALGVRVANTCLIALTGALVADVGRVAPRSWGINRSAAFAAGAAWILLNDVFYGVRMNPWSSVVVGLLLVAIVWFIARYKEDSNRLGSLNVVVAGALTALVPFTRQSVGVVLFLFVVAAIALSFLVPSYRSRETGFFLFGIALGFLVVAFPIVATNSVDDWFTQSVLWPILWAGEATSRGTAFKGLEPALTIVFLTIGALVIYLTGKRRFPRAAAVVSSVFLLLLLAGLPLSRKNLFVASDFKEARAYVWSDWILQIPSRALFMFLAFTLLALLISIHLVARQWRTKPSALVFSRFLLIATAVSSLTQIYPVPDSRHIWWALPPAALLLAAIPRAIIKSREFTPYIPSFGVWILALVLTASANLLLIKRIDYPTNSVLAGMKGRPAEVERINRETDFMTDLSTDDEIIFMVADGYVSVISGKYLSKDEFFVDWGPVPSLSDRTVAGDVIVSDSELHLSPGWKRTATVATSEQSQLIKYSNQ